MCACACVYACMRVCVRARIHKCDSKLSKIYLRISITGGEGV